MTLWTVACNYFLIVLIVVLSRKECQTSLSFKYVLMICTLCEGHFTPHHGDGDKKSGDGVGNGDTTCVDGDRNNGDS